MALRWDFLGSQFPNPGDLGFFPQKIPKAKSHMITNPRDWDFLTKIPGIFRDWDTTLFGKNPMGFKIPGIGIFFVELGFPTKKPPHARLTI